MQAVVDCNYLLRDIVVGRPGSVHDARVLSNSETFRLGEQNKLFPEGYRVNVRGKHIAPVILGDPAYPLLPWLLRPYPENKNTVRKQRRFNHRLSRARVTVENAFGRWRGKFRRFLKRVDMHLKNLVTVIAASCIMHNICEIRRKSFCNDWKNQT